MDADDADDDALSAWTETAAGGAEDDLGDAAATEAPFEIVDHTTVTPWERLVAAIEDRLRSWRLQADARQAASVPSAAAQETAAEIDFEGASYLLQYYGGRGDADDGAGPTGRSSGGTRADGGNDHGSAPPILDHGGVPPILEGHFGHRATDFTKDGHVLGQWFGVRQFLLLAPAEQGVLTVVGPDLARTLLGALRVAEVNVRCELPCFVQVDGAAKHHYRGFLAGDGVDAQLATATFDRVAAERTSLAGLAGLLGGAGAAHSRTPVAASANSPDRLEVRPSERPRPASKLPGASAGTLASLSWTCAVQFQYGLSWFHDDWRALAPIPEPSDAYLGWGPRTDPVPQMDVAATWPTYPAEIIADDAAYDNLDAARAPEWSLHRRLRPRVACPLASLLADLVAAVGPMEAAAPDADAGPAAPNGAGASDGWDVDDGLGNVIGPPSGGGRSVPRSEDGWSADGQFDAEAVLGERSQAAGLSDGHRAVDAAPLASMVHSAVTSMLGARSPRSGIREGGLVGLAAGLVDGVSAVTGSAVGPMPSPEERELLWAQLFAAPGPVDAELAHGRARVARVREGCGQGADAASGLMLVAMPTALSGGPTSPKAAPFGSLSWYLALHLARELVGYPNHWTERLAVVWNDVVTECRQSWESRCAVVRPRRPLARVEAAAPDVHLPLLHQKLQMLQYCIARTSLLGRNTDDAGELAERSTVHGGGAFDGGGNGGGGDDDDDGDLFFDTQESASAGDGWDVSLDLDVAATAASEPPAAAAVAPTPRGRKHVLPGVFLREHPDVPAYAPVAQDPGPMTEDAMDDRVRQLEALGETAEGADARLRLQSASLVSDMEAFKAANPGAVLEDFVRWHSPNDWIVDSRSGGVGHLSARMAERGNTWQTLWANAEPVPASQQHPLFHVEAEAEKVLHYLTTISADELIQQLLPTIFQAALDSLTVHQVLRELAPVNQQIQRLRDAMAALRWDSPTVTADQLREVVRVVRRTELLASVALSLLHKLPESPDLVARLLEQAQTLAATDPERDICYELLLTRVGSDAIWQPDCKALLLRLVYPQPTPSSRPQLHRLQAEVHGDFVRIAEVLSSDTVYH